ncbi:hypothetical protein D3C86_1488080 [compost metagenome]
MFPASGRQNSLEDIELAWNGLVLSSTYRYAPLDDARSYSVMPEMNSIEVDGKYYRYFYLIKGTLRYLLYEFIWSKLDHFSVDRYKGSIEQHFMIFEDNAQAEKFKVKVEQQKEIISQELDTERAKPENAHLSDPGFYYGFEGIDTNDYIDSRFFVSKSDEILGIEE